MQKQYQGRYKIIKKLSTGGISEIYLGFDIRAEEEVVIKSLREEHHDNSLYSGIFEQEILALSILKHPNIISMIDSGVDGNSPYIILKKIEGNNLKSRIRDSGKLNTVQTIEIAIQVCNVVCFMHKNNFIHGDIKPQNILLQSTGKVVLSDFGLAHQYHPERNENTPSIIWGSPKYFAPEITRGEQATFASDVYSIGVVLYEMLVGIPPFDGKSAKELAIKHRTAPIHFPGKENNNIPESLINIIFKSLEKSPNARYPSACAMEVNLELIDFNG